MGEAVDKDIELIKIQIIHDVSLQDTISKLSNIISFITAYLAIYISIQEFLLHLDAIIQLIIRIGLFIFIIYLSIRVARLTRSISMDYKKRFKRISEMVKDVKQGKELPKLEDIAKELS